jgi:hypothetical protein
MKICLFPAFCLISVNLAAQTGQSADTVCWDEGYHLTWTDFKGEPLEFTGLGAEATCFLFANFERTTAFSKLIFHVNAVFDRTSSWVNPKAKSESGLVYFRLMFDLYEVHARQLRKELAETRFGLDPNPLFRKKYNNAMNTLMNEFNEFRKETKMGTDKLALYSWKSRIAKELGDLKDYAE